MWWSERRGEAFAAYLAKRGLRSSVFTSLRAETRVSGYRLSVMDGGRCQEDSLAQWLTELPQPVGLMACNDSCGQLVLRTCGELGIMVPEQVAVVGVDNDDLICELCDPPLSSVDANFEKMGYAAAAALVGVIRGDRRPRGGQLVEPFGVVLRESTDVRAISDRDVAAALHFIRQHSCEGIGVEDVCGPCVSRGVRSNVASPDWSAAPPRDEISQRQLERVKSLLTQTEFPLKKIAELAGFNYLETMCRLFKRLTGQSPIAYRTRRKRSPFTRVEVAKRGSVDW